MAIRDEIAGKYPRKSGYDYPDIRDGIIGMAFIETVVKSSKSKENGSSFPLFPSKRRAITWQRKSESSEREACFNTMLRALRQQAGNSTQFAT